MLHKGKSALSENQEVASQTADPFPQTGATARVHDPFRAVLHKPVASLTNRVLS